MTEQPAENPGDEQIVLSIPIPVELADMVADMVAEERLPGVWRLRMTFKNGRGASIVTGAVGEIRAALGFPGYDLDLGTEYEVAPLDNTGMVDMATDRALEIDHMTSIYDVDGVVMVLEKIAALPPQHWAPASLN